MDVDARMCETGIIGGVKGLELVRAHFRAAVAPQETIVEVDAHLPQEGISHRILCRRDLDRGEQILLPIRPHLTDRQLRPGEENRLAKAVEHKAEHGSGVSHGVGPMEYHEAAVLVIILPDGQRHLPPVRRPHLAGVDHLIEGVGVDMEGEVIHLRYMLLYVGKVYRLERTGSRILGHADRPAGIDKEDSGRGVVGLIIS